jgi:hypothetical protein
MGYCYFCEEEWVGYVAGGYYCENCSKLSKLVKCLGSEKLLKNIRFKMDVFDETKKDIIETEPVSKNTRSKSK